MKSNTKLIPLWFMFLAYGFCCITLKIDLWMLLSIWATGLSIFLLIKTKLPSKKGIVASAVLAVLVSIAYLGIRAELSTILLNGIAKGVPTFLCSLAIFSVMETIGGIMFLSTDKKLSPLISIMIAISVAAVLSVLNYFLMRNDNAVDFGINATRLIVCLSPAIYEEIVCRAIFMAFFLFVTENDKPTKFQRFTMWFMMCFPHTAAHGYDIVSTIILCVLFGLPFAVLQKKRDVVTAMVSHGLVDAVRFTVFGLGL